MSGTRLVARHTRSILSFRAVRDIAPALPTSRPLFLGRY